MIPLTLSVRNFLSYGENIPSLDFRAFTIACLSGKNGHGKSALVDAMTWALWGKCRVKNKEEVMKGKLYYLALTPTFCPPPSKWTSRNHSRF